MSSGNRDDSNELGRRRLRLVALAGAGLWLLLAVRLVQVQGLEHDEYAARARGQYERRVELKATRGPILDRRHKELAVDIEAVTFAADPTLVKRPGDVARHFSRLGRQAPEVLAHQLEHTSRRFVYLARQLDGEELEEARSRRFSGVFEYPETRRHYPYGGLAGQLLGHTSIDNKGREGVELAFDAQLRETNGDALFYVDGWGRQLPGLQEESEAPKDGTSVVLTIDASYQDILEEELEAAVQSSEAERAMGILSDPRTGEILAMANVPLCDPNEPGAAPASARRNRTLTDPFEPGSTFKAIALAAALEDGLVRGNERIHCEEGKLELENGEVIRDIHPYGWLSVAEVLAQSSNIGTIKIARRLERPRFYEYIRNFGFGTRSGVGLPAESAGLLQHVSQWSDRSLETITFGQEIGVTGLQLVQAFGAIANGGLLLSPRLVSEPAGLGGKRPDGPAPQAIRRVISPATAARLRAFLAGVVANGTGQRAQLEGVAVAGKTGTAQRAAANGKGYAPEEQVASFIGFLPADDPTLLCLAVIDNPQKGKWGGHVAALAFRRTMERIRYLGDGRVPARVRVSAVEDTAVPVLPDLRGMTREVADYQAGLRGLDVRFGGEGGVVVNQDPPSGAPAEAISRVSCLLGTVADASLSGAHRIPRRQRLLLRYLTGERSEARQ